MCSQVHKNNKEQAVKMCVHLQKNRALAIKSTLKVGHCYFMTQHKRLSANTLNIKGCNNREADNTQKSSAPLKRFQIIYQTGLSMTLNFTSSSADVKARYMLNTEECFRQGVWRTEIWYWTEWMATCDISESGSIDLTMSREDAETLDHRPLF